VGPGRRILTLNAGSSSLRFSLHRIGRAEERLLAGRAAGLGGPAAELQVEDGAGHPLDDVPLASSTHRDAVAAVLDWLVGPGSSSCGPMGARPDAVGHRIVHGGERFVRPARVTPEVTAELERLVPLAPDHMPAELSVVRAVSEAFPDVPQVVCFDTAFHRTMPAVARRLPLPPLPGDVRVERYGFHGLSYEYLRARLREIHGSASLPERIVLAHLGSGASLAALRRGRPVDTTMGFTPAGGLMMSTRPGDLDPGILLYLLREQYLSAAELDDLVNRRAGLAGVSGTTPDMRRLLETEGEDDRAAAAVELFCYLAVKQLGAMAAVLEGLDTLTFSGGIGERSAPIRRRIASGAAFLGVRLDDASNERGDPVISAPRSEVTVRVIPANEELMIARHAAAVLDGREDGWRAPQG